MKISIVGCGGISRTHIGAVREIPDARIISVADCIPERAQAAAEQCGAKAYTSLEAMLSGEKPDILHICTTPTINGLVRIANNTDILKTRRQKFHQLILRMVSILILIYMNVLVALLVISQDIRILVKQTKR